MTVRMRLRRWARTQGKRRAAARTKRSTAAGSRRREQQTSGASQLRLLRLTVCGALFVSLVLLKLVLPGNLSAFRGTLAQWLVRDADFTEAFSAIGHAVAAPERFAESLGNAYVAVFGGSGMQDAAEVGGGAEIAHPDGANAEDAAAKPLPDYVLDAQPTLPFSYVSPLDGALTSGFGWREDPNTGAEALTSPPTRARPLSALPTAQSAWWGRAPCSANI